MVCALIACMHIVKLCRVYSAANLQGIPNKASRLEDDNQKKQDENDNPNRNSRAYIVSAWIFHTINDTHSFPLHLC